MLIAFISNLCSNLFVIFHYSIDFSSKGSKYIVAIVLTWWHIINVMHLFLNWWLNFFSCSNKTFSCCTNTFFLALIKLLFHQPLFLAFTKRFFMRNNNAFFLALTKLFSCLNKTLFPALMKAYFFNFVFRALPKLFVSATFFLALTLFSFFSDNMTLIVLHTIEFRYWVSMYCWITLDPYDILFL